MHSKEPPPLLVRLDARGARADLATLDALARIRLVSQRHGIALRVVNASSDLHELAALAGLEDVLLR